MGVSEPQSFTSQSVHIGGPHMLGQRSVTADIPVAKIVGEDNHNIGFAGGLRGIGGK